ncbi:MAG: hypothetical protein JJ974_02090 [Phycisphaerales bacterium]|nr:hypothetical protein [Phycisphaerales bacterium]
MPLIPSLPSTLTALSLSATILLAGCEGLGQKFHDTRVMRVEHVPNQALDIVTANGSIKAQQEARDDVSIEVELYGYDPERLDFATVIANRQGDGTLRVTIDWPGGKRERGEGAKIKVYTPDANNVTAKTSNGAVALFGLNGEAYIATSNGAITIHDHDGDIDANTSNGSINIENASGNIRFDSSNARVKVENARGEVQGDTSNGSIYISTTDGSSGPIRVRTSNGRVELDLGYGYQGVLGIKTSNGRIKTEGLADARLVESSKNSLKLKMGNSEEISAVQTSNGSVSVRGRADN